ncbi:NADP-dependent glyceraldehyde-3-phosphate dehydrogenase [Defluviitalea saccharophila]|uniref:NADP-dependent glyceraldehyde-3-phosphate dehydrogenase n=1 Tax=Defluviitalea saccharophila TaxID=879970 RepID=A0ABZ2Y6V7_9FIRM|nr:NADP-dependent glyceraldehyde-3-phosphate dehydrogenase [Candidatus Epulonipiscium sp.]
MFSCIFREGNIYKNLCGGQWTESSAGERIQIYSPVDDSLIGEIQAQTKEDVDFAVQNAKDAQKEWAKIPISERANIIHKAARIMEKYEEEIADVLVKEIAKAKSSAISEVKRTVDFMHFTAETAKRMTGETIYGDAFPGFDKTKISLVERVPLGVILCIAPFNYPVNLSISKIAPALVGGNSVVFKPPTQGSISAMYLGQIFCEAGLPPGVLNIVTGKGSEIGDYLITHPGIDMINFTGSTEIGHHIAKEAGMIPLLLELGGKDAAIVLEDCDLDETAQNIVKGAFNYSGQRCTAVKRVLLMDSIADELASKIVAEVAKLTVGRPEDDAQITPLINDKAADFVQELIDDAIQKGAKLLIGNKREKRYIWPTVFDHVTEDMRIAWEEPFGPVLPIIRVKTIEEAIDISNRSEYGLQGCVFTKNIDKAFAIAQKLEVGTVQINNKTERGPDHFPFLGVKASGLGTQGIRYSIEAMTRSKAIVINLDKDFQ